ncbi:conserved hypothetical protein [Vibrio rotiferianus]|nr:conserved hypothetical protein [Vibrio rotiferianus]
MTLHKLDINGLINDLVLNDLKTVSYVDLWCVAKGTEIGYEIFLNLLWLISDILNLTESFAKGTL